MNSQPSTNKLRLKKTILRPNIADADWERKAAQTIGWLIKGHTVVVELRHQGPWAYRGNDIAKDVLKEFIEAVKPYCMNISKPCGSASVTRVTLKAFTPGVSKSPSSSRPRTQDSRS